MLAFGSAAGILLGDRAEAARMGQAAQVYVRENFLGDVHLLRYGRLLGGGWHGGLRPAAWAPRLAITR